MYLRLLIPDIVFTIKSKLKEWRSPQELIMKVITVVEVWREWAVFPDDFFLCLETLLIGQSAHTSDLHNQLTLRSLLVKSEVVDLEDYAAELRKHPYNELKSIKSCHGVPNVLKSTYTLGTFKRGDSRSIARHPMEEEN